MPPSGTIYREDATNLRYLNSLVLYHQKCLNAIVRFEETEFGDRMKKHNKVIYESRKDLERLTLEKRKYELDRMDKRKNAGLRKSHGLSTPRAPSLATPRSRMSFIQTMTEFTSNRHAVSRRGLSKSVRITPPTHAGDQYNCDAYLSRTVNEARIKLHKLSKEKVPNEYGLPQMNAVGNSQMADSISAGAGARVRAAYSAPAGARRRQAMWVAALTNGSASPTSPMGANKSSKRITSATLSVASSPAALQSEKPSGRPTNMFVSGISPKPGQFQRRQAVLQDLEDAILDRNTRRHDLLWD